MKKLITGVSVLLTFGASLQAQTTIAFTHDSNGRMTKRSVYSVLKSYVEDDTVVTSLAQAVSLPEMQRADSIIARSGISVSPNPTKGLLLITVSGQFKQSLQARFYTMEGRPLKTVAIAEGTNDIDLSEVASGIYLLRIAIEKNVLVWEIEKQ